jgi:RNA recognition motif-containing protein
MSYKILVANMPFDTSGNELKELFGQVGTVGSVSRVNKEQLLIDLGEIIQPFINRITHSRPFYSIEMLSLDEAAVAVEKFQGVELPDRPGYVLALSGPHGPGDKP